MKKSFISILITNHNKNKYLQKNLKNCFNQNYDSFEVIVYDDRSTDDSIKTIKKFKKIKLIQNYKNFLSPPLNQLEGLLSAFKRSKGNIICLLDSDDYFARSKIDIIVDQFKQFKKVNFLQNLPNLKNNQNNSSLSFWPYLAPESCISFRRKFIKNFMKKNYKLQNKFESVWLGFRLGVYAFFIDKSFLFYKKKLTYYRSHGESKKYPRFGLDWFQRRLDSFEYLYLLSKKKIYFKLNHDFLVTLIIIKIYKFLKNCI